MTITATKRNLTTVFVNELRHNDGCIPECCESLNDASRAVVDSYRERYGTATHLGRVNLYKDRQQALWQDDGKLVRNFACSFVLPEFDQTLHDLIIGRHKSPYTGTAADYELVGAIHERIDELGGALLHWS